MSKKRTIFIGLGGVGGQMLVALRRAKAAGCVPEHGEDVKCLYLDAADDVAGSSEWQEWAGDIPFLNLKEEARSLNEMEQNPELKDCVNGMRWQLAERLQVPVYEVEQALSRLPGTGGLRRYGRALLLQSWPAVQRLLQPMVEGAEQLEIHVFFSAAGGMGSGAALDMLGWLEKICLRQYGSILLPYAFFVGTSPQEKRLAAELADWLELAHEDMVPHCYLSSPVVDLPTQEQTLARALACGQQFFYVGGEYYDHLYDSVLPRGAAAGDRFASLGFAEGPQDDLEWVSRLGSLIELQGSGKGPRHTLLVALPRSTKDPHRAELAWEDALEDGLLPYSVNESGYCCMAPCEDAWALLLQTGIASSRVALWNQFSEASDDYFAARDDRE